MESVPVIYKYRPARDSDRQFIISGGSSSLRMTRDLPLITMEDYAGIMHGQFAKALVRDGVQTIVAEGSVLAGFITFERGAHVIDERGVLEVVDYVYYVYVAKPFRRNGVARELFEAAGIDPMSRFHYAARTKWSWELRNRVPNARYSSLYARYSPEENKQHEREHAVRRKART
jgi:GNAT superfamily N-acetyltransferase